MIFSILSILGCLFLMCSYYFMVQHDIVTTDPFPIAILFRVVLFLGKHLLTECDQMTDFACFFYKLSRRDYYSILKTIYNDTWVKNLWQCPLQNSSWPDWIQLNWLDSVCMVKYPLYINGWSEFCANPVFFISHAKTYI